MTDAAAQFPQVPQVVVAERVVAAPPDVIFELIADPARQPEWDGNDNLGSAAAGQRVRAVGDVFTTTLTSGADRDNHVVEFEEGRRIAWLPGEVGAPRPGHLWRWEVEALPDDATRPAATPRAGDASSASSESGASSAPSAPGAPSASSGRSSLVRHTYDWSGLRDETRLARARATTPEALRGSLDRLAALAQGAPTGQDAAT